MDTCSLVSIVVPVYNVEPFCRKCFDSLLAIEYLHKEIILVDDCSTDGCGAICDEYSKISQDIHVIHHSKNAGVAQARLTGTGYAHGEYVMFVDADDYVAPQIVNKMLDAMMDNLADIVCCQCYRESGDTFSSLKRTIWGIYHKDDINRFICKNVIYDIELNYSGIPLYLWGKLFKREDIYDSLKEGLGMQYGEDGIVFLNLLINKTNCLICIDDPLYYYVRHSSQVTQKNLSIMWSHYVKYWEKLDSLNLGVGWSNQLSRRIWSYLKPSIYDNYKRWGGIFNNQFISTYRSLRNTKVVKKYLWNNKFLPKEIKRHPHYILLWFRLYRMDFLLYALIWACPKN